MKRTAPVALLALAAPAAAIAQPPTAGHKQQYLRLYHQAAHRNGRRAPGRNVVKDGLSTGRAASNSDVTRSIGVLQRMLAPAPVAQPVTASSAAATSSTAPGAPGGLAACIIQAESGGNPQAVNGQYEGIGQWSPTAWQLDGGTQYAPTPLGASYSQQLAVLEGEGAAGMQAQQAAFDGC